MGETKTAVVLVHGDLLLLLYSFYVCLVFVLFSHFYGCCLCPGLCFNFANLHALEKGTKYTGNRKKCIFESRTEIATFKQNNKTK